MILGTSNAIKIDGTIATNAIAIGNKLHHMNVINWSYRNRGNVARVHTKKNINKQVFNPKIILCKLINELLTNNSGTLYPPKNRILLKHDINTIEQYSPRKKNTKIIPECSVKNPATNSDSASGKSKGVRFVSLRIEIK